MSKRTVMVFTRNGMGHAPEGLQQALVVKYLSLLRQSNDLPGTIVLYTDGVKLACQG